MLAYRSKRGVGDTTIAKELGRFLPEDVSYDSTLKNVQRLRKGHPIKGAPFLNACVQFLEVNMVTPPEEELGLAMGRFAGGLPGFDELVEGLEGEYALRVLGESQPTHREPVPITDVLATTVVITPPGSQPPIFGGSVVTLCITKGEGNVYGVARESYSFPGAADNDDSPASALNRLRLAGLALPVGGQDLLIMMRDFTLSHMYVLRRANAGFEGILILLSPFTFFRSEPLWNGPRSQYDVKLERQSE